MSGFNYSELDLEFLNYFNSIHDDAEIARSNYFLLECIGKLEEDKFKVFNISSFSWQVIFDALRDNFIISVSRIFDLNKKLSSRSDVNIISFINFTKNNFEDLFERTNIYKRINDNPDLFKFIPLISKGDIDKDIKKIHNKEKSINSLIFFRDKSYAHKDKVFLPNSKVERPNITYNQINDILDLAVEITEHYRLCFDGVKYAYPAAKLHDIDKTIDILYEFIKKRDNEHYKKIMNL